MPSPFATLIAYLEKQRWTFDADEETKSAHWGISGEHAQVRCIAAISDEDDLLQVFVVLPVRIPEGSRIAAAEFCTRATYGMKIGRFETDLDDGEVRVHASAPFRQGDLPESVIHHCIGISLLLADHYFPDLMSVVYGETEPDAAVASASARLQDRGSEEPADESDEPDPLDGDDEQEERF